MENSCVFWVLHFALLSRFAYRWMELVEEILSVFVYNIYYLTI